MCGTFVSYKKFYYSSPCFQYFVGDDIFYGDLRVICALFSFYLMQWCILT